MANNCATVHVTLDADKAITAAVELTTIVRELLKMLPDADGKAEIQKRADAACERIAKCVRSE